MEAGIRRRRLSWEDTLFSGRHWDWLGSRREWCASVPLYITVTVRFMDKKQDYWETGIFFENRRVG